MVDDDFDPFGININKLLGSDEPFTLKDDLKVQGRIKMSVARPQRTLAEVKLIIRLSIRAPT